VLWALSEVSFSFETPASYQFAVPSPKNRNHAFNGESLSINVVRRKCRL
jgi:hypothetical protein